MRIGVAGAIWLLFATLFTAPAHAQRLSPQGGTIVGATTGGGLAVSGSKLGLLTSCATNEVLKWNGSAWACGTGGGGGGTVSGTTGNLSVFTSSTAVGDFAGNSPTACTAGNALTRVTIASTGALTFTCSAFGSSSLTNSAGANVVTKSDGTNLVASSISDNGTYVLTSEPTGIGNVTTPSGQLDVRINADATTAQPIQSWGNNFTGQNFAVSLNLDSAKNVIMKTSSANTAWKFNNSSASTIVTIDTKAGNTAIVNAGNTQLGSTNTNTTTINGGSTLYDATGSTISAIGGTGATVYDDTAFAAGVGGAVILGGKYTSGGAYRDGAFIKAKKTNATDANDAFDLALGTRANGGSLTERMTIGNSGNIDLNVGGTGTTTIQGNLTVNSGATVTIGSATTFNSTAPTTTYEFRGTVISPAQITANQNDYAACLSKTCLINSDAARNITGFTGGNDGEERTICNTGSFQIVIKNEDAGSTAANRVTTLTPVSGDIRLPASQNACASLVYSSATSRWRQIGGTYLPALTIAAGLTVESSGTTTNSLVVSGLTTTQGTMTFGNDDADTATFAGKISATGTDPALSSCGTSPTILGSDHAGTVTVGTGTATSCTLTFASAYSTNAPACILTSEANNADPLYFSAKSTSAFTITTAASTNLAGQKFNYICTGI